MGHRVQILPTITFRKDGYWSGTDMLPEHCFTTQIQCFNEPPTSRLLISSLYQWRHCTNLSHRYPVTVSRQFLRPANGIPGRNLQVDFAPRRHPRPLLSRTLPLHPLLRLMVMISHSLRHFIYRLADRNIHKPLVPAKNLLSFLIHPYVILLNG